MTDETREWPHGHFEPLRAALQKAMLEAGMTAGEVAEAFGSVVEYAEWADGLIGELYRLVRKLSIDDHTGLLKVEYREQLAFMVRRALETEGIEVVLSGAMPMEVIQRWVEGSDKDHGSFCLSCDGLGLGYINKELGMRGGNAFLRLLADTCVKVLDDWLKPRGERRRLSVMDGLEFPSVVRRGGDEFIILLLGAIVGRAYATRDRLIAAVSRQQIPGLDIAPTMAIGLCSVHAAIAYTVMFHRWRDEPLPQGEDLVTQVIEMCLGMADAYSDQSKFVEYGLLFAEVWEDQKKVAYWLTSKLRASAFNGRSEAAIRALCTVAHGHLVADDRLAAQMVFEEDLRDRAVEQINRKTAGSHRVPGDNINRDREVFILSMAYQVVVEEDELELDDDTVGDEDADITLDGD